MLNPAPPVLARPTYSSISLGGSPAAATRVGSRISSGMIASIAQHGSTVIQSGRRTRPRGGKTMAPRVNSELLLVGSLPADSADSALRAAAGFFGDLVFALPDGETGPRSAWVGYERERLVRPNPGVVVVEETESPTGIPRHAYETPVFAIAPGVTELRWDSWPRIDDAIAGYRVFSALRSAGVIPGHLRFQVGLPFPSSALNAFKADFAADYPVAERAFEDLVARELTRLTAAIPPAELAIQWDLAYETQDIEGSRGPRKADGSGSRDRSPG